MPPKAPPNREPGTNLSVAPAAIKSASRIHTSARLRRYSLQDFSVMRTAAMRKSPPRSTGLPGRLPDGTRYVIEGRRGKNGRLQIVSRQVILPTGEQFEVEPPAAASEASPAKARSPGQEVLLQHPPEGAAPPRINVSRETFPVFMILFFSDQVRQGATSLISARSSFDQRDRGQSSR